MIKIVRKVIEILIFFFYNNCDIPGKTIDTIIL